MQSPDKLWERWFKNSAMVGNDPYFLSKEEFTEELSSLIERERVEARIDEQEKTQDNLPHCGGDECMSCLYVDDYGKDRLAQLRGKE